jgi:hypothetical protein
MQDNKGNFLCGRLSIFFTPSVLRNGRASYPNLPNDWPEDLGHGLEMTSGCFLLDLIESETPCRRSQRKRIRVNFWRFFQDIVVFTV